MQYQQAWGIIDSNNNKVVHLMIGERIKETRGRNGLTQSALAKRLGISRSAVNAWEMGISIPSAQYLIELSNQFNVSVDFLLERTTKEMVDITFLSEEEKHLIYIFLNYFKNYEAAMRALKEKEQEDMKERNANQPAGFNTLDIASLIERCTEKYQKEMESHDNP